MKIIMINQDATVPPYGYGGRSYFLFEEFNKIGHTTDLLKAKNSHLHRSQLIEPKRANITSLFTFKYKKSNSYLRIVNWFLFSILVIFRAMYMKVTGRVVDIVYYSSPSLVGAIAGLAMAKIFRVKFVFEFRDIWPLTLVSVGGFSETNIGIKFMRKIEKLVVSKADLVVSTLPGGRVYLEESGFKFKDYYHSPNGVNTSELSLALAREQKEIYFDKKKLNITYAGSLGKANAIDKLMPGIIKLRHRQDLQFHIIGDGTEKRKFEDLVNENDNIIFYGHLDKFSTIKSLADSDVALIAWHDLDIYRFGVSANKLFEYMALGLPIINIYSGDYDYVSKYQCGVTLECSKHLDFVDGIIELSDVTTRQEAGQSGQARVLESHTYDVIAANLIKKLDDILDKID
jgi:glycosyltransferase involved in cell wall biosynthesis